MDKEQEYLDQQSELDQQSQADASDLQSIEADQSTSDQPDADREPRPRRRESIKITEEYLYNIQKSFKLRTLRSRKNLNRILGLVKRGDNRASQYSVIESLKIDDDWLTSIEGHINHIDNIVRNPKSALKEERIVVNTSKAKRTDSETIRYLSSHTSDIESINGDEIRPSKLNVREIDSDIAIYENRFVYALMVRLRSFLEQRYIAIKEQLDSYDTSDLRLKSNFDTDNGDVEYDLRIKLRNKRSNSVSVQENHSLLERIESCRMHLSALMGSDFARALAKTKLLMPPINKTNAIRGHVDYRGCYNLWLFLSSYTAVGYSVKVEEQNMDLANDYYDDLTFIVAMSVKNMMEHNKIGSAKIAAIRSKVKKFKPIRRFSYTPSRRGNVAQVPDEQLLNQFYYEKVKSLLKESEDVKLKSDEPLNASFRSYYKSISILNNKLYDEALSLEKYREYLKPSSNLETKQEQLAHYEEGLKRIKLLRRLKESDFKAIEREEQKNEERVAKLRVQIKEIKEKRMQEALEKKLAEQRKELEKQEAIRLARLEKQRLIAEKKQQAIDARLEKQRLLTEAKEKALAERLAERQRIEQEKEAARLEAEREKQRERIAKQKEREAQLAREKRQKQKEADKLRKQREAEKLKKEQQLKREKEKLAAQKQREKEKLAAQKQREKEKLAAQKQREKEKLATQKQREQEKLARQKQSEKKTPDTESPDSTK